jgi:hypothetical protein
VRSSRRQCDLESVGCRDHGSSLSRVIGSAGLSRERISVEDDQTLGSPCALTRIVDPGGVVICTRCS